MKYFPIAGSVRAGHDLKSPQYTAREQKNILPALPEVVKPQSVGEISQEPNKIGRRNSEKHVNLRKVSNPKLGKGDRLGSLFPYYAGYSEKFVNSLLDLSEFSKVNSVLDPWNGSGTTTLACSRRGISCHGLDLNPAMVVVAKARLLPGSVDGSLSSILAQIAEVAIDRIETGSEAELEVFFAPSSANSIRSVRSAIDTVLVDSPVATRTLQFVSGLSTLAAFYYVLLFRVARRAIGQFATSNPTWTKSTPSSRRTGLSVRSIVAAMSSELDAIRNNKVLPEGINETTGSEVRGGDSRALPLANQSVTAVISSPPYCTRIDYAVATRLELAVLGAEVMQDFSVFRKSLIGSTLTDRAAKQTEFSTESVSDLLEKIRLHPSKASDAYYLRTYREYFSGMEASISEVARVLAPKGLAALVVQDSHYKELYIDLQGILTEAFCNVGMRRVGRTDFSVKQSLRAVHRYTRAEARQKTPTESVLVFQKD